MSPELALCEMFSRQVPVSGKGCQVPSRKAEESWAGCGGCTSLPCSLRTHRMGRWPSGSWLPGHRSGLSTSRGHWPGMDAEPHPCAVFSVASCRTCGQNRQKCPPGLLSTSLGLPPPLRSSVWVTGQTPSFARWDQRLPLGSWIPQWALGEPRW